MAKITFTLCDMHQKDTKYNSKTVVPHFKKPMENYKYNNSKFCENNFIKEQKEEFLKNWLPSS